MDKQLKKLSELQQNDFEILVSQTELTKKAAFELFKTNNYDLVDSLTYYNDPDYKPPIEEKETDEIKQKIKELRKIAREKDKLFEAVSSKIDVSDLFNAKQRENIPVQEIPRNNK